MGERHADTQPLHYAGPGERIRRAPLARQTWVIVAALCLAGGVLLWMAIPAPCQETWGADGKLVQVVIPRPPSALATPGAIITGFLLVGFALPLAAAIILLRRRRIVLGVLLIFAGAFGTFGTFAVATIQSSIAWTVCDVVTGSDGVPYYFLDTSFLQGQTMAIAVAGPSDSRHLRFNILGTNNGDSPRSYALIVRPFPPKPVSYGALYATADGWIVGVRYDNACYLAWDLAHNKFYGHDDVEALSPFILLDEKGGLHAPDEAAILAALAPGSNAMGRPSVRVLEQATKHPNPAIRQSAARMLQAVRGTTTAPAIQNAK